jgi:long-chain acyl-CoA synthetase
MHSAVMDEAARSGRDISTLTTPDAVLDMLGGYGQTEIHGLQSFRGFGTCEGGNGRTGPMAQVRILRESGREADVGEVGEICVRGPVVMLRYHNRGQRNHDGAPGWHRTNDLGRRESDGSITFIAPKQRMLKSGKENIYPVEVERRMESHQSVRRCAVIGRPDDRWVQRVVAVVELEAAQAVPSETELIEHCRLGLASYKKPREIEFVDALPVTPAGAIDYAELDRRLGGGGYPGRTN